MNLSKVELAETCTKKEGTAKLIEFSPWRETNMKLPSRAVFVIAISCVEMNKAATSHFNIREGVCWLQSFWLSTKVCNGIKYGS
ncbi:hypothetical protein QTO34_014239 [Cnephaeus nilssonii]|uniref:Uncharacterized protein n=1 Tax=Cnephaeus nilssonii TaxID=3371016 RepID=A0AA40I6U6_CNENI|nr:hypothetical protein QTO34_014239 [Eptesicus nilssonii]